MDGGRGWRNGGLAVLAGCVLLAGWAFRAHGPDRRARGARAPEAPHASNGEIATPPPAGPLVEDDEPVPAHPPDPVALFDSEEVDRLLAFLLDPAHQAKKHVEARGRARAELEALVAKGGLPLVHEAIRRMQDPAAEQRKRAQLFLALAADVPRELIEDLRHSADPLVHAYPDLRAGGARGEDTRGDGGDLGDGPLLDVAEEVRLRLWPDPEPNEETWSDEALPEWPGIRENLRSWWKHVPPEDRFLLAGDEMLVVARDVARTWLHHRWRFIMLLRRGEGRWRVAGFHRLAHGNERIERVLVADFDGDGRPEAAVWTTIVGGWTHGRLVVVGSAAPDGVATATVYGDASEIRLVPPRWPGDRTLFGVCDVHLPADTGHWGYLSGVVARECDLLAWSDTGFSRLGYVWLPLQGR